MNRVACAFSLASCVVVSACSGVTVRKIPTPTQYGYWDDERQREADAIEGFRYPLPRPYVVVRKEFPLASTFQFVPAQWDLNSGTLRIAPEQVSKPNLESSGAANKASAVEIPEHSVVVDKAKLATIVAPKPPTPRVVGRAGAVSLTASHQKQVTRAAQSVTLAFQVPNAVLAPNGNEGKTVVRELYLAPLDGSVKTAISSKASAPDGWVRLPMACLEEKGGNVDFTYRGYLPDLKTGAYVAAVHTIKRLQYSVYEEEFAYNVNKDGSGDVVVLSDAPPPTPGVGRGAPAASSALLAAEGLSVDMRSQNLLGPKSRVDFTLTVEVNKLKTEAGVTIAVPKQLATSLVGVALCPLDAAAKPDLAKQILLPIDLRNSVSAAKAEFPFSSVTAEEKVVLLPPGLSKNTSYAVVAMIEDASDIKAFYVENKGFLVNATDPVVYDPPDDYPKETTRDPLAKKADVAAKAPAATGGTTVELGHNPKNPGSELLSEYLAITYLPDSDEQYAVKTWGGPYAKLSMSLKNGWMMESVNAEVDNSAIYDFVFQQIDKATDLVTDVVRLDKGLLAPATASSPDLQSSGGKGAATTVPVTLKVTRVKHAVPGLYPILKPRELIERQRNVRFSIHSVTSNDGVLSVIPGSSRNVADMVVDFGTREDVIYELVRADLPKVNDKNRTGLPTESELQALLKEALEGDPWSQKVQSVTVVLAKSVATLSVAAKPKLTAEDQKEFEDWARSVLSDKSIDRVEFVYP